MKELNGFFPSISCREYVTHKIENDQNKKEGNNKSSVLAFHCK